MILNESADIVAAVMRYAASASNCELYTCSATSLTFARAFDMKDCLVMLLQRNLTNSVFKRMND
jgi:hypothetical protein